MPLQGEAYRAYMRNYMRVRHQRLREEAVMELGGRCVSCGATESLEFDHKNPSEKSITLHRAWIVTGKRRKKELAKCQLLCNICHREKSIQEQKKKKPSRHGSLHMYMKYQCRCPLCKTHYSQYKKQLRVRSSIEEFPPLKRRDGGATPPGPTNRS